MDKKERTRTRCPGVYVCVWVDTVIADLHWIAQMCLLVRHHSHFLSDFPYSILFFLFFGFFYLSTVGIGRMQCPVPPVPLSHCFQFCKWCNRIIGVGIWIPFQKQSMAGTVLFRLDATCDPLQNGILIARAMLTNTENHFWCCYLCPSFAFVSSFFGRDA